MRQVLVTSQPRYSDLRRPELLGTLSSHAVEAISSSVQRIVVCPTRPASLPWAAGYAEVRMYNCIRTTINPKTR